MCFLVQHISSALFCEHKWQQNNDLSSQQVWDWVTLGMQQMQGPARGSPANHCPAVPLHPCCFPADFMAISVLLLWISSPSNQLSDPNHPVGMQAKQEKQIVGGCPSHLAPPSQSR